MTAVAGPLANVANLCCRAAAVKQAGRFQWSCGRQTQQPRPADGDSEPCLLSSEDSARMGTYGSGGDGCRGGRALPVCGASSCCFCTFLMQAGGASQWVIVAVAAVGVSSQAERGGPSLCLMEMARRLTQERCCCHATERVG